MTIKQLDRAQVRALHDAIAVAVGPLAKQYGVTIRASGGTFDDVKATLKLEVRLAGPDGELAAAEKARKDWTIYAPMFGLEKSDFGRSFNFAGERFTVCALKPGAWKMPILGQKATNGKRYKFSAEAVVEALKREKVAA